MPSILVRAALLAPFCAFSAPAIAQELPRFDVEATCRAAPALLPQDPSPYESCVRDERDAEGQLRAAWAGAAASARRECTAETRIGGPPSYVDVLTCLEMYAAGGTAPPLRRRAPARE